MFLKIFSSSKLEQFSADLVQDLVKRYPPAMANNPVQMVSEKRLSILLESSFLKAQTFAQENHLGTIRKAILGNGRVVDHLQDGRARVSLLAGKHPR